MTAGRSRPGRAGLVHAWIHSRYGKTPVILVTTPQPQPACLPD